MADHPFVSVLLTSREETVDPGCVCGVGGETCACYVTPAQLQTWQVKGHMISVERLQVSFLLCPVIFETCHARRARLPLQKHQSESKLAEAGKDRLWKWKGIWSSVTGCRAACLSYVLSNAPFWYYVSDEVAWLGFSPTLLFIKVSLKMSFWTIKISYVKHNGCVCENPKKLGKLSQTFDFYQK